MQSYSLTDQTYKLQRLNPASGTEYINYIPRDRFINTVFYLESAVDYNRTFHDVHGLGGLLVYTMRSQKTGISDNLQLSLPSRNMGISGRLTYNYDSRYFAEFNFGYNGSERFSANNRWGFFPSAGFAWMVSNEPFFEPMTSVFTQLKLKGTYGLVGNDGIGSGYDRFYYLSEVDMDAGRLVNWGTQLHYNPLGINISRYATDRIGWETAYKTNMGL